jgi:hypothetical protein
VSSRNRITLGKGRNDGQIKVIDAVTMHDPRPHQDWAYHLQRLEIEAASGGRVPTVPTIMRNELSEGIARTRRMGSYGRTVARNRRQGH